MNISSIILRITSKLKPVLVRLIPISLLRKLKRRLVEHNTERLSNIKIQPFDKSCGQNGVNLIGNIRINSGLGQSMRLLANELEHSSVSFEIYEHHITDEFSMTDHSFDYKISKAQKYNINIFHINPYEFTISYLQLGVGVWNKRYNIAFWLWELEEFPQEWVDCISMVDEIWTPAEFISNAIRKVTGKPVITIPYHVEAPTDEQYNRDYFKLPEDKYLYLMVYDRGSMTERKNPKGVLNAFKKAFDRDREDVGLVIKINGDCEEDVNEITSILNGYTNVYFITDILSKVEINSLIKCVDVVVSLHRAEGFGLVMAEAMLNGVPTIATNWSANTEFMDSSVACMVNYTLVPIEKKIGPYNVGQMWAEPDIDDAARCMRYLYENREEAAEMAERAKKHIENILGMERITKLIEKRIDYIYHNA